MSGTINKFVCVACPNEAVMGATGYYCDHRFGATAIALYLCQEHWDKFQVALKRDVLNGAGLGSGLLQHSAKVPE